MRPHYPMENQENVKTPTTSFFANKNFALILLHIHKIAVTIFAILQLKEIYTIAIFIYRNF